MSLLGRFRRTILPSSSHSQKNSTTTENENHQHNYRKATKSFNGKSVKPKKSQFYAVSNNDNQYNDVKEKSTKKNNKQLTSSTHSTNKRTKKNPNVFSGGNLARSDTFTLEDEAKFQNATYPQRNKKGKSENYESNEPYANRVNQDVFETFYAKRSLKSSHSSKSSNDSIRVMDEMAPFSNPITTEKDYSSLNRNSSSFRTEKLKPREYLFGSTFDRKVKDKLEKENVHETYNTNLTDSKNPSDRFKTITINNLRRSFRDTFLGSTKPTKGREHQQVWFINVDEKRDELSDNEDRINKNLKNSWQRNDDNDKYVGANRRVMRNETFRVDTNDIKKELKNKAIARRETFRINKDQSPAQSVEQLSSPDSNSSITLNFRTPSSGKLVPIAVTAPYSASNDTDMYYNPRIHRKNNESFRKNHYNSIDDDDEQKIPKTTKTKNFTEITTSERNHRKPFEIQSVSGKHSLTNFNVAFDVNKGNYSYTFHKKNDQKNTKSIDKRDTNLNTYDEIDSRDDFSISSNSKSIEPWRNISSRQFSDGSENRSFVPYRSNYNETKNFTSKTKNNNRTTINISNEEPKQNYDQSNNKIIIPLTANKMPSMRKTIQNKNRSVNFPSVECEVRLISPNYDIKPRRKLKPANDWTFNKKVDIREIEDGTKCMVCKQLCPGFKPHLWRKTCLVCKCSRESHAIYQEQLTSVKERLGIKPTASASALNAKQLGYTWIPPGISTANKIRQYFDVLPENKVPKINTAGVRYREQQLSYQWPKQDLALQYCNHIEPQNNASYEDFIVARNEIALDIAYVKEFNGIPSNCINCDNDVKQGDLAVIAPKFGEDVLWHPKCFTCSTCNEMLVDLTYCVHDDKIYCERHYAEVLKPRCNACDELIFSGEYTKAMNQDWHASHFSCWNCDESLTGQRYVLRDDHPYCIKCYENVFANTCDECNKIIGIDSKDLSYKEKHWHEACFLCNKCRVSLVDKQFGSKAEKIYCGNCYDSQFASRCDGCGEVFRAGTKKMEYKTRQWHEKCFSCCVCKNPIGTKSFIPKEQEIYCAGCYEEKYATRCIKCTKIITSGGVTYKNDPWHRECFTCTHCTTSLAGQRFTSRDEKPYCAECFGELFAKRCTSCTKPITGIGGTRFISFEDRHWHNDCFICASCKTSLVGRGFITDEADIICPECAKAKLM